MSTLNRRHDVEQAASRARMNMMIVHANLLFFVNKILKIFKTNLIIPRQSHAIERLNCETSDGNGNQGEFEAESEI